MSSPCRRERWSVWTLLSALIVSPAMVACAKKATEARAMEATATSVTDPISRRKHGVALWIWHVPALFQATLESDLVHTLQHVSFLGSALLFWWALIHGRQGLMGYGVAVLYVFSTAM